MSERSLLEQAVMRYCCPRGIPITRFTEQRVGVPEWTEADIVTALEWQAEQDRRCGNCGANLDESTKKENTFAYKARAISCHGCRAIHSAAKALDQEERVVTRYQFTKTPEASDGRVDDPGAAGSETEPARR